MIRCHWVVSRLGSLEGRDLGESDVKGGLAVDTRWARRKLDRARALLAELEHASADWVDPVIHALDLNVSDSGGIVEATLEFQEAPPLEDWALIVGDCAHNIRTALDVFVWANSVLLPENVRGLVAYPILARVELETDDEEEVPHRLENQSKQTRDWVSRKVAGLPEPLRSRVVGNMRWASMRHEGDLIWHQRLPLIKELDDIDKHRLALRLNASPTMATWNVQATDVRGQPIQVSVSWSAHHDAPAQVGDRVLIASGVPASPIARVDGTATIALGLQVRLFDLSLEVREWLAVFIEDVEGLLDVLGDAE